MMEHVKPQHSFSRVRPVLVKGEEVCCALDGARLAVAPEAQNSAKEKMKYSPKTLRCFGLCVWKERNLFFFLEILPAHVVHICSINRAEYKNLRGLRRSPFYRHACELVTPRVKLPASKTSRGNHLKQKLHYRENIYNVNIDKADART